MEATEERKLTAIRTGQTGNGVGDRVLFEARSSFEPTLAEIADAQLRAGYHPNGYGGPGQIQKRRVGDEWVTTFNCFASCD